MCLADTLRTDLAQTDAAELSCLDILGDEADGVFNGHIEIDARAFEEVEKLLAVQQAQCLIDAPLYVLLAATDPHLPRHHAALDGKDHFVSIFGILGEVLVEQMSRVALRRPVELAAVPVVRAVLERSLHSFDALRRGWWALAPCHSCDALLAQRTPMHAV
jgi:hypothetical protein